jgi:hypothetical protein
LNKTGNASILPVADTSEEKLLRTVWLTLYYNVNNTDRLHQIFPARAGEIIAEINKIMADDGSLSVELAKLSGNLALKFMTKRDRRYFVLHRTEWIPILRNPPYNIPTRFIRDREIFHTIQVRLPSHIWISPDPNHRSGVLKEIKNSNQHLDIAVEPFWINVNTFSLGFYCKEDIPESVDIYAPDRDGEMKLQHLREFHYFPPR